MKLPGNHFRICSDDLAKRTWILSALAGCLLSVSLASSLAGAAESSQENAKVPASLTELLDSSCVACHEGEDAEGGLDLTALGGDLADPQVIQRWVRIHDRVRDGEMPPPDDGELPQSERESLVSTTASWLTRFQRRAFATQGRVRGRRLTNRQLEQTLQSVLGIDIPLASFLPAEPRNKAFAGIADQQSMSHFQLQYHVDLVDVALSEAFDRIARDAGRDDKAIVLMPKDLARKQPDKANREPELRKKLAVVWSSTLEFYGQLPQTRASQDGWYEITVTASAIKKPKDHGVWCSVRSGTCRSDSPTMHWIGSLEAVNRPRTRTYVAWMQKGHMLEIRPIDGTIKKVKFRSGQAEPGLGESNNVPGVGLHKVSVRRIDRHGSAEICRQKLLGDLPLATDSKAQTIRLARYVRPKDMLKQLRVFIESAFRRQVTDAAAEPFIDIMRRALAAKMEPTEALRATYRAVLCSPRFIYFVEPINTESNFRGAIDQHAIANRLSYLLTSGPPDQTLRQLADEGKLLDRDTLRDQVERLLDSDASLQFIKEFAHEWLDLVDINFTTPDRRRYGDFDILVQHAMLDETHLYLNELIRKNQPARKLIVSDFTYLNNRLARHYGIPGVNGDSVRRVKLPPDSIRGGLLGQGAILKVTANGTATSPVLRGVWISERILGQEVPPPPDNVPAVEPDTRGAKTIRQQLEKHIANDACASCHRRIDPPGYALENFDPTGKWRSHYIRNKKRRSQIDPSFVMADGRPFDDFNEFRQLTIENDQALARNFVEKLLVYGTGASIQFADRPAIERVVEDNRPGGYGLKSLIQSTVTSPIFLSK